MAKGDGRGKGQPRKGVNLVSQSIDPARSLKVEVDGCSNTMESPKSSSSEVSAGFANVKQLIEMEIQAFS